MKNYNIRYTLLLTAFCLLTSCAFAKANADKIIAETTPTDGYKDDFCRDYGNYSSNSNGNFKIKKSEIREFSLPARGVLEVDGQQNGGISIVGENRSDLLVRVCVRAWAKSDIDAINYLNNTQIETNGVIRAVNSETKSNHFSVSYRILVPLQQNVKLSARNGGIAIKSVDGNLRFNTVNGGISLKNIAGDVQGRTINGGVAVKLSGNSFNGTGLDVVTTNGGVSLVLPRNYAADIEVGTVNGGIRSDFSELQDKKSDKRRWHKPRKIKTSINGGGTKIRVVTTNGGVNIASSE